MNIDLLKNVIIYFFKMYPNPLELSKPRLVKMIYLADWKNSIENKNQITDIKWLFNHYGPYVEDVIQLIKNNTDTFSVKSYPTFRGGSSDIITLNEGVDFDKEKITSEIQKILDFVINSTAKMPWNNFISLVYSTYPIRTMPRYSELDLPFLANEYKNEKQ